MKKNLLVLLGFLVVNSVIAAGAVTVTAVAPGTDSAMREYVKVKIEGNAIITSKTKKTTIPEDLLAIADYCTYNYKGSKYTAECYVHSINISKFMKVLKTKSGIKLISSQTYIKPTKKEYFFSVSSTSKPAEQK